MKRVEEKHKQYNTHPPGLLLFGSLRYLGRGWCFDDLQESTSISEEVYCISLHILIEFGSSDVYSLFVKYSKSVKEGLTHMRDFIMACIYGGAGLMDASHVTREKCSHRLKKNHIDKKSKQNCKSFNLTYSHRRKILYSASGYPTRWNNTTIVLIDEFATQLRKGKKMNDDIFPLLDYDENGVVCSTQYCGACLLVDIEYLIGPTTIPPIKKNMFIEKLGGQNS